MKCARCGHEIDPHAPRCEWCARGAASEPPGGGPATSGSGDEPPVCCPVCGSTQITAMRRVYDPGCGCLGLLLFSWIGLLLGFLNGNRVDMVCSRCGHTWEPGKPDRGRPLLSGCGCLLVILLVLALLSLL